MLVALFAKQQDTDVIEIVRYNASFFNLWNDFLSRSKNGVFLFHRDYMEYHADRFNDYSLMFFYKNKLIALLPANRKGATLFSHAGLTFGGLVTDKYIKIELMLNLFRIMVSELKKAGINKLIYKAVPHIYHIMPAEEDLCALPLFGARLVRRDVALCLHPMQKRLLSDGRKTSLRKGQRMGVSIQKSNDFCSFMDLLECLLKQKYNTRPVHTLEEIQLLADRFKDNIKLFTASLADELLAGVILFEHSTVAHVQYIATSANGKIYGGLDVLVNWLLENDYRGKQYFDFGTSSGRGGTYLNSGVIMNKESYGARTIAYDLYELSL